MKRCVPLFAVLCVSLCHAAPVGAEEAVKPLDLLKRAVDAHAKLGPATLECKTELAVEGRPLGAVIKETVQRNDQTHSFTITEIMVGRHAESTFRNYVDGDVKVTYNPDDKEYGRTPDEHDVFLECIDAIRSGLLYPEQSKEWGQAKVKAVTFEKASAHKVTVKNLGIHHRDHPDPKSVTLVVDPATNFVRQYEVDYGDDITMTMSVKYKPQSNPFPPSTFTFVVPPGAKESKPEKTDLR